ncbi:chromosome segregation protein SMC [Olsenella sp. HMSC062G07]|uniref:chromosome segregation protein SMC n=1 Tax=Olsenella sp. HMSC062G07 TaxID=1739330 RepID=UPI0008A65CF2|nr:chromosome segregation protein SMC [Olsenella sp. HMSC062G07]OFK24598.1 chromosome segregation protein SMC [Olsenella sp. HMSC062G07]
MYLKSLTLKGFKSFADRTQLSFDPGLTVVVGPNGSGKSNISDAILWVLGEQSAKTLRGQAMEDVIFSGSSGRPAVGLAEVTLTLDNEDHTLPIDFAEIAITRRMYRSGESEYLINGASCRLRDITDILHDSGLGKDTHSIISQGKLDAILASRPEERRSLIEEAAGISKHRRRKERAERKLASMQDNLTRAKDIQREVTRQLRPLERQVDKARRHRELADELSRLSCVLAVDDLRALREGYARLEGKEREADAAVELAQWRLDAKTKDLEKYQSLLEQKGIFVGDLGEQRRRMQSVLGRMESDMRLLEEKGKNMVARVSQLRASLSSLERGQAQTAQERRRVSGELADARREEGELDVVLKGLGPEASAAGERRRSLGARLARMTADQRDCQREADKGLLAYAKLRDQIDNAEVEDDLFRSRLAQIEDSLATTQAALDDCRSRGERLEGELDCARERSQEARLATATLGKELGQAREREASYRDRLASARATHSALKALDERAENANQLVAALAHEERARIMARVGDLVEAPSELEGIVELLLGDDLAALVTRDADDVRALTSRGLSVGDKGRATMVFPTSDAQVPSEDAPGFSLLSRLRLRADAGDVPARLLGRVRIVESLDEALRAHEAHPTLCFATREGVIVRPDGRTSVGAPADLDQGALERKRRIRRGAEELARLERDHRQAGDALADIERRLGEARERDDAARGEVARLAGELKSLSSEQGRLEAELRKSQSEQAQVITSREAARARCATAREEVRRHKEEADAAQAHVRELDAQIRELTERRSEASREERELSERLASAKLRHATVKERASHLDALERQLGRTAADSERRRAQALSAASSLDVVLLRVEPLHARYDAVHERALAWAARLKDRASLAEADSDSLKRTIGDARAAVSEAAAALEVAQAQLSDVKVSKGKLEIQVENALSRIREGGWVLEEALSLPAPDDRAAVERRVEGLRRDIEGIGPVNEVAMDEYARLRRRVDYIAEQVEDLERARQALRKITSAIERKMRRQFVVVFDRVNANFAEIFSLLFSGGTARLELVDPERLDETGIEIVAQPRGKKIQKMTLMSGGEKSLTALALLFAVYRARTVPFYVFDEVEAALDDANLSKLLDAVDRLKETTQLIVISHQRRTMEQADVLYGVSMRADGVSHVVSQRLDKQSGKVVDA